MMRAVLELLFQAFVSFNVVELFLKCSSTNLRSSQSCSGILVNNVSIILELFQTISQELERGGRVGLCTIYSLAKLTFFSESS